MNSKKNILFVSHKANRSGAPLLLLEIIKEFKQRSKIPFKILVIDDGELVKEFALLGKTYTWNKNFSTKKINFFSRIKLIARGMKILYSVRATSLVFFNTIANGHLHKKLLFLKCRYVYYIHELEAAIHMLTNKETLQIILNNTHLFFAVSEAVRENLILNHSVNSEIIKVVTTPFSHVFNKKINYKEFISAFKYEHKIPGDGIIIGAVGPNEWRKGFDLFFPLIKLYFNLFPESKAYFIWKGFNENNISSFFDRYEINKFNTGNRVLILPYGTDSIEHIACLDIHLLLSREDPYPLVMLEAAAFAIPTVCFLYAGGSPEFVEEDSGICVLYGDLFKMATALHELVQNTELRNKLGTRAQEKVKKHSFEKTIPEFITILEQ